MGHIVCRFDSMLGDMSSSFFSSAFSLLSVGSTEPFLLRLKNRPLRAGLVETFSSFFSSGLFPPRLKSPGVVVVPVVPVVVVVEAAGVVPVVPVAAPAGVAGFAPKRPPPNNPPDGAAGAEPVAPVVPVVLVLPAAPAAVAAVVPWGSAGLGGRPKRPPDGAAEAATVSFSWTRSHEAECQHTCAGASGAR